MPKDPSVPIRSHGRTVRVFLAVTASLSLLVGVVGGISYGTYQAVKTVGETPWHPDQQGDPSPVPCVDGVCNYLILGSDSRQGLTKQEQDDFGTNADIGGENRADTIMLVHSDPRREKVAILSFPRDLWVQIPGHEDNKINAAFEGGINGGGPALVADTIHELTGLRVNHFVYVDLAGFQRVVDTLDGVDMCIPATQVNTPGWLTQSSATGETQVYYREPGHIVDPNTGLDILPGCQLLHGDQALAYVRTRHLPCDTVPDFARINRQQEFLRAVINRLLQPSELLQAPSLVRPILSNIKRDPDLTPADLAFVVGQMRGLTTGAVEFRSVPGRVGWENPSWSDIRLSVVKMDPSAEQVFAALRDGKPLPAAGTNLEDVAPSAASIVVPVVDHDSEGKAAGVEDILSQSGFDIAPGVVTYDTYGADVKGSVIAYEPGRLVDAQVVGQFFPGMKLVETPDDALAGADVAVFVTSAYTPQDLGSEPTAPACI